MIIIYCRLLDTGFNISMVCTTTTSNYWIHSYSIFENSWKCCVHLVGPTFEFRSQIIWLVVQWNTFGQEQNEVKVHWAWKRSFYFPNISYVHKLDYQTNSYCPQSNILFWKLEYCNECISDNTDGVFHHCLSSECKTILCTCYCSQCWSPRLTSESNNSGLCY